MGIPFKPPWSTLESVHSSFPSAAAVEQHHESFRRCVDDWDSRVSVLTHQLQARSHSACELDRWHNVIGNRRSYTGCCLACCYLENLLQAPPPPVPSLLPTHNPLLGEKIADQHEDGDAGEAGDSDVEDREDRGGREDKEEREGGDGDGGLEKSQQERGGDEGRLGGGVGEDEDSGGGGPAEARGEGGTSKSDRTEGDNGEGEGDGGEEVWEEGEEKDSGEEDGEDGEDWEGGNAVEEEGREGGGEEELLVLLVALVAGEDGRGAGWDGGLAGGLGEGEADEGLRELLRSDWFKSADYFTPALDALATGAAVLLVIDSALAANPAVARGIAAYNRMLQAVRCSMEAYSTVRSGAKRCQKKGGRGSRGQREEFELSLAELQGLLMMLEAAIGPQGQQETFFQSWKESVARAVGPEAPPLAAAAKAGKGGKGGRAKAGAGRQVLSGRALWWQQQRWLLPLMAHSNASADSALHAIASHSEQHNTRRHLAGCIALFLSLAPIAASGYEKQLIKATPSLFEAIRLHPLLPLAGPLPLSVTLPPLLALHLPPALLAVSPAPFCTLGEGMGGGPGGSKRAGGKGEVKAGKGSVEGRGNGGESARGVRESARGVRESARGVRESACGVRESARGVRESARGVRESARGVRESARGVRESARGVRESARGVRESARGVRESARGVRESARGVRESARGSFLQPLIRDVIAQRTSLCTPSHRLLSLLCTSHRTTPSPHIPYAMQLFLRPLTRDVIADLHLHAISHSDLLSANPRFNPRKTGVRNLLQFLQLPPIRLLSRQIDIHTAHSLLLQFIKQIQRQQQLQQQQQGKKQQESQATGLAVPVNTVSSAAAVTGGKGSPGATGAGVGVEPTFETDAGVALTMEAVDELKNKLQEILVDPDWRASKPGPAAKPHHTSAAKPHHTSAATASALLSSSAAGDGVSGKGKDEKSGRGGAEKWPWGEVVVDEMRELGVALGFVLAAATAACHSSEHTLSALPSLAAGSPLHQFLLASPLFHQSLVLLSSLSNALRPAARTQPVPLLHLLVNLFQRELQGSPHRPFLTLPAAIPPLSLLLASKKQLAQQRLADAVAGGGRDGRVGGDRTVNGAAAAASAEPAASQPELSPELTHQLRQRERMLAGMAEQLSLMNVVTVAALRLFDSGPAATY
ncbi:unnamed protein product [Closterium sp. Yama58-4]|nr:unnamed protein product [Closterium sp. Yama58-4]